MQHCVVAADDVLAEPGRVIGECDELRFAHDAAVAIQFEFDLGDDAQPAVAADRRMEQRRLRFAAEIQHFAVRGDHAQRDDAVRDRAFADVTAVAVHRHRAADGEIAVALHDRDRQFVRVDQRLQLAPAHARLYAHAAVGDIQMQQPAHAAHVEMQRIRPSGLSAHAVASAAYRYRRCAARQRCRHRFGRRRTQDRGDFGAVEPADVVDALRVVAAATGCGGRDDGCGEQYTGEATTLPVEVHVVFVGMPAVSTCIDQRACQHQCQGS